MSLSRYPAHDIIIQALRDYIQAGIKITDQYTALVHSMAHLHYHISAAIDVARMPAPQSHRHNPGLILSRGVELDPSRLQDIVNDLEKNKSQQQKNQRYQNMLQQAKVFADKATRYHQPLHHRQQQLSTNALNRYAPQFHQNPTAQEHLAQHTNTHRVALDPLWDQICNEIKSPNPILVRDGIEQAAGLLLNPTNPRTNPYRNNTAEIIHPKNSSVIINNVPPAELPAVMDAFIEDAIAAKLPPAILADVAASGADLLQTFGLKTGEILTDLANIIAITRPWPHDPQHVPFYRMEIIAAHNPSLRQAHHAPFYTSTYAEKHLRHSLLIRQQAADIQYNNNLQYTEPSLLEHLKKQPVKHHLEPTAFDYVPAPDDKRYNAIARPPPKVPNMDITVTYLPSPEQPTYARFEEPSLRRYLAIEPENDLDPNQKTEQKSEKEAKPQPSPDEPSIAVTTPPPTWPPFPPKEDEERKEQKKPEPTPPQWKSGGKGI